MTMIYLDNAATSWPKPEAVYRFMDGFYRSHGVNPGRSGFDLAREAGQLVDETRTLLCELFGGTDPNRLCFAHNATDALNLAISGLVGPSDHVVTSNLEHNSVLRPLYALQAQGLELSIVSCDTLGFVQPEAIRAALRPNTRLVVLNHASNVIGTVQPVADIGEVCRKAAVPLLLDASQSAGVLPVDVGAMGVSVLAFTGHKGLMGPTGTGGLYVAEGLDVAQVRAGGTGVRSASKAHLPEYPYRLEYGTQNLVGIAGLNAGVRWIAERGAIRDHEAALLAQLVDGLRGIRGVTLYCADDLADHIAVVSFNIGGFEAEAASMILDVDHDIACRTGLHCAPLVHDWLGTAAEHGAIRFSLGPFNTAEHVRTAIEAVADVAAMRN